MWEHIITFGVGIVMRLWNEQRKDDAAERDYLIKARDARVEDLNNIRQETIKSTFLQTMMMFMVMTAFLIVAGFSLIASWLDVPLVVETIEQSGFWIFSKDITVFKEITGLLLPEEFRTVIIMATEFIFGAVVGGIGRR